MTLASIMGVLSRKEWRLITARGTLWYLAGQNLDKSRGYSVVMVFARVKGGYRVVYRVDLDYLGQVTRYFGIFKVSESPYTFSIGIILKSFSKSCPLLLKCSMTCPDLELILIPDLHCLQMKFIYFHTSNFLKILLEID